MASDPRGNVPTAAQLLVAVLEAHGVDRVFCVPGESYLAVLDALYGRPIDVVTCRHESGAGFMAVADAKLTGEPSLVYPHEDRAKFLEEVFGGAAGAVADAVHARIAQDVRAAQQPGLYFLAR